MRFRAQDASKGTQNYFQVILAKKRSLENIDQRN